MNYTLHQLQVFYAVAETGSVTKAAEQLHLTQPAVSIQLRNFQDQFDLPLTEVVGRKLYLTDFGKEIAGHAELVLNKVKEIELRTSEFKGRLAGRLKISVVSTGKYVMPYYLKDFLKQHPDVELKMDVTNKEKVVESLQQNEVDFALVSILPEKLKVNKIDLLENKLYLVGNREVRKKKEYGLKQYLSENVLLFRERGSGTRQSMERILEKQKVNVLQKLELTSNEAVKQSVLAGLGISIMPLIGIRHEIERKDLQILPVKGLPISTMWSLIWLKEKQLHPVAKAYTEFLKHEVKSIF
jgi:DNA-binding transcriptional LysR family regulator